MADAAEEEGFDSLFVGDGLLHEPRHDPLALLGALAERTSRVRLGTACLRVSLRDPLTLAMAWATIDQLSGGRTILGACAGNAMDQGVRREFAVQGLDPGDRMERMEEAVQVLRSLWTTGRVDFSGRHFRYEDVAFESGTEIEPLRPQQRPPPIWIASNPHLGNADPDRARAAVERAARRIVRPRRRMADVLPRDPPGGGRGGRGRHRSGGRRRRPGGERHRGRLLDDRRPGTSPDEAREAFARFIAAYYPTFGSKVDLGDWGPVGTPDDVGGLGPRFADAGVTHLIVRFGSMEPLGDLRRFANEVIPAVRGALAE